jgi:hypothetical protein
MENQENGKSTYLISVDLPITVLASFVYSFSKWSIIKVPKVTELISKSLKKVNVTSLFNNPQNFDKIVQLYYSLTLAGWEGEDTWNEFMDNLTKHMPNKFKQKE